MWYSGDGGAFTNAAGTTQATVGQQVRVWADRSGNARNATQATAANRPLFHRQTAAANGQPGLRFTGDLFIDGPSPGIANNSSYTYLFALRDTSMVNGGTNDGAGSFVLDRTTATNELVSLKAISGNLYFYQKRSNSGGGLGGVQSTTTINTAAKIITMRRNYNANYQFFYNNIQQSADLADADGLTTPPPPRIGRHATSSGGGIRGYIYEFIVYNFALNPAQRIIVNNYLAAKYNLSLLSDDIYTMDNPANGNYDYEVAGIGRWNGAGNTHTDAQGSSIVRMNTPSDLDNNEYLIWGHDNGTMTTNNTVDVDGTVIQSRLNRIWRLNKTGSGIGLGTVTVSFDVTGFTTVTGSDLRLLIDRDGDGFSDNDVTPLLGSFAGNIVTFTGVGFQDGDRFTLGSINVSQTPLPVELLLFSAIKEGPHVRIRWSTASESNSDHFKVERSVNGIVWAEIAHVHAQGNSVVQQNYFSLDLQPLSGTNYYRLKMVDQDASVNYSTIVPVDFSNANEAAVSVFVNSFNGEVILNSENVSQQIQGIYIYDISGKLVFSQSFESTLLARFPVEQLSAGTYVIVVNSKGKSYSSKFVRY